MTGTGRKVNTAYENRGHDRTGLPRLNVTIPANEWPRGVTIQEDSGRCLIAEWIKHDLGAATRPIVDMNYITITVEPGVRVSYRTPATAKALLLDFDHGNMPQEEVRIIAVAAHVRERQRRAGARAVRDWARQQPELAGTITDNGPVSDSLIAAFEAATGKKVEQGERKRPGQDGHNARPVTTSNNSPATGALASGSTKIPANRRRTFGDAKLTDEMIRRGWTPPGR